MIKDGFFSSILDYQFVENNYTLKAHPVPQMMRLDDTSPKGSSWLIKVVLLAVLILPLVAMCFVELEMGRVWSLYFMLQIASNIINFANIQIPANALLVLEVTEQISNFKIC